MRNFGSGLLIHPTRIRPEISGDRVHQSGPTSWQSHNRKTDLGALLPLAQNLNVDRRSQPFVKGAHRTVVSLLLMPNYPCENLRIQVSGPIYWKFGPQELVLQMGKEQSSTCRRGLTVQAGYSEVGRPGNSSTYIRGFLLGGIIFGTLGCVYAPQASITFGNSKARTMAAVSLCSLVLTKYSPLHLSPEPMFGEEAIGWAGDVVCKVYFRLDPVLARSSGTIFIWRCLKYMLVNC